jgi:hypothetical protein
LITITSQRLSRVIDRCRYLLEQLKDLIGEHGTSGDLINKEGALLFYLMEKATQRSRILQRALTALYLSLGIFIATSITLGVLDVINSRRTWIPVLMSLIGALMLFYVSILLIRESQLAKKALNREMTEALRFFKINLEWLSKKRKKRWWWRKKAKSTPTPNTTTPPLVPPAE